MQAAAVRVSGELNLVTAPQVVQVLDEALEHARLIMVNVRDLSFVDDSGLQVLVDATRRARTSGARLVLVGVSAELAQWFAVTGTRPLVDMLPGTPSAAGGREDAVARGFDPLLNPVNARIVAARVMDIPDRALWAHSLDGTIRCGWAPAAEDLRLPVGAPLEVYLDHQGAVNGWWHTASRVAVNQRHLTSIDAAPTTAAGLACQGACELIWQAPAAVHVLDHDERCLTCAGALVLA
ncbi:anti-sigma factor antagonist [Solirubrobacter taibaiensis]|nr:anti-sigma factor antagonist [Solirubrobacter taibaiensis]